MQIIPAILSETLDEVQSEFSRFRTFIPQPKVIQVDIIDGEYADNITIEPGMLREIETYGAKFDLHLMTNDPIQYLYELRSLPNLRRVIAQVERMDSAQEFVTEVQEEIGAQVGISLDLYTKISSVGDDVLDILDQVDVVQVMANKAGMQGQSVSDIALETLKEVVEYRQHHNLSFAVAVDIGMNEETIAQVQKLGATEAVTGSYLQGPEAQERWKKLRN